ncbi:dGTP triphosphohydrolase [Tenuifilum thalassicum]|uniref:DNTP triphosphohydrolase n=1 Tax=Tenuifilum thalassicum TaxID=2590900 RepID=A0A7D3XW27_9BACT|nr:dNTP triphosphohydrolase [Tenuifilum thalassicum]QKG80251.1 dNTP triphosphohydrolase [Tenuifilum thalassicum]
MKTDLNKLYSSNRTGVNNPKLSNDPRTDFQRDFDRIIFSSPFRRLQNKTQVFPLPGSVFVHNRLTHSLEVSSVGRSLGSLIGQTIYEKFEGDLNPESQEFYKYNLSNVIAAACLCHDIGNPAFGHSGEDAIASFFVKNEAILKNEFTTTEWSDLINFEGNANAIRVLTHNPKGKSEGGLMLTYSTLAAIAKYPCESVAKNKNFIHRKKFGFFQSEKPTFVDIANRTGMIVESNNPTVYRRHPFVWLVEVADDICYNIVDLEDAHRLGIIESSECIELLRALVSGLGYDDKKKIDYRLDQIYDKNDRVSYLRAKAINALTLKTKEIFERSIESFLDGTFETTIFSVIKDTSKELAQIMEFSYEYIYNNRHVVEIENAGYNVMYELLNHFIPPILKSKENRSQADKKALRLLPPEFNYDGGSAYQRVLGVLDYVSGMTDNYATDFYRRIKGIEIGMRS